MQRIEPLGAAEHAAVGGPENGASARIAMSIAGSARAAEGAAHVVDERALGLVPDVLRDGLVPRRYDIRGQLARCSHAFSLPVNPRLRPETHARTKAAVEYGNNRWEL